MADNQVSDGASEVTERDEGLIFDEVEEHNRRLREAERVRQRERRANESEVERRARLDRENARRREARSVLNAQELQAQRAHERAVRSRLTAEESDEQRRARLAAVANARARSRSSRVRQLIGMALRYDTDTDYASIDLIQIGSLCNRICPFCSAYLFPGEVETLCCRKGTVKLNTYPLPPSPLNNLFNGRANFARGFLEKIRSYNCCFRMTSFGVSGRDFNDRSDGWMPTFRIQGQIHHRIGSLLPVQGNPPQFLQVYFMGDEACQLDRRTGVFAGLNREVLEKWQHVLLRENHLIREFKTCLDQMEHDDQHIVICANRVPAGQHAGRYNAPLNPDEVAMIIVDGQHGTRDIVIKKRAGGMIQIVELNPCYDALQYPLIFWRGQRTYDFDSHRLYDPVAERYTNAKLTSNQFYRYHLMARQEPNYLLMCGPLSNQYWTDMYCKIESERLRWFRLNQRQIRAENYAGFIDGLAHDLEPSDMGSPVILPSTFTGGPRYMHEKAQDSMAIVRLHGRPDLFITFTCNPNWSEIRDHLMPGQKSQDRHDLITRVFNLKLRKMMDAIFKYSLFGPCKAYTYTIEWQKRGLPHAHILFWLNERVRPDTLDSIICAELPDPEEDSELFGIISRHMIHGPCGPLYDTTLACHEATGRCRHRFPRPFRDATQLADDGYPAYRRRSPDVGGITFQNDRGILIDNQWVVPYNRVLSRMFNAHINVEYCHSVKSIKYICKYINKGHDKAMVEIQALQPSADEVSRYVEARYLCSGEAIWRIFNFDLHQRHPAIQHLQVHLEGGQRIYFNADDDREQLANRPPPRTTLTAFFELCQVDDFARSLLYSEVPTYYTWNQSSKTFNRRKRGRPVPGHEGIFADDMIGRIYTVGPRLSECFHLRLLLINVRGPTSFEHLRTVRGNVCDTYRQACRLLGLLEDDRQWVRTLEEAQAFRMPKQLRQLFAMILCECQPSDPMELWNFFQQSLSEDIFYAAQRDDPTIERLDERVLNHTLILIEDICLNIANKRLCDLGMVSPDRQIDPLNTDIIRERNYDTARLRRYVESNVGRLVPDQRRAYNTIIDAIQNKKGGLFFIDAPGGTGKTFLTSLILAKVRSEGEIVVAVASSGIAATLLEGGKTAHSTFNLPLDIHTRDRPKCTVNRDSAKGNLLRQCSAIFWDECTMAHRKSLEAVDKLLQDLTRRDDRLMGGIVFVLTGDFRQTLPVIPRGSAADEMAACLKRSHLWSQVQILNLRTNMRVLSLNDPSAESFSRNLLILGEGRQHPDNTIECTVDLPSSLCRTVSSREELFASVFPDFEQMSFQIMNHFTNLDWLSDRAILAPTNAVVDDLNSWILSKAQGREYVFTSVDTTIEEDQSVHFPTEFLNSYNPNGFPPHELKLKIGSPVILLRNLDPPRLCNGTRLVVHSVRRHMIMAIILNGSHKGEKVMVPRIPLKHEEDVIHFKRLQLPIRLAYAMTINKSQGQTLKVAGIDLTTTCFSHGQLYVACSRVGKPSSLFIQTSDGAPSTKNIVYKQALQ